MSDYIGITFKITTPSDENESSLNTLILLLDRIRNMMTYKEYENGYIQMFNYNIERMKLELENLKIKEIKAE